MSSSLEIVGLMPLASIISSLLGFLMFFLSIFLILLVLVQRGKGGGLTGALGGPGGQSAFGSKAGDTFTVITAVSAIVWGLICAVAMYTLGVPPASADEEFAETPRSAVSGTDDVDPLDFDMLDAGTGDEDSFDLPDSLMSPKEGESGDEGDAVTPAAESTGADAEPGEGDSGDVESETDPAGSAPEESAASSSEDTSSNDQ